jgi:putative two-component system response regulator
VLTERSGDQTTVAKAALPGSASIVHKASIMVVDDQPANLKLMEDILRPQGYKVRSFPRGKMALAEALRLPPDLILLDINMPEMTGLEVCERLQENEPLASIPVIFLTAMDQTDYKVKAFHAGGLDYLTKPVIPEEVHLRIESQLRLCKLRTGVETRNRDLENLVKLQVDEIAQSRMTTIFAMAKLAESRDAETGKHLERVQVLCRLLATETSRHSGYAATIGNDYIENIFHASPLHDIGKVAIPDSILVKPGKLALEEFDVMKTHTTIGAQTLRLVLEKHPANAFVSMGIEIALSHHEKWDGSGYPAGLAGYAIPVSARIMAIADCYDALRSRRCYKEPMSHEESRNLILREGGHHFDPSLVAVFIAIDEDFRQVWEQSAPAIP